MARDTAAAPAFWFTGNTSIPSATAGSRRVRGSQVIRGTGSVSEDEDLVILRAPALLKRVGREMRLLVMGATDTTPADPTLLKLLARAHRLQARLIDNTDLRIKDLAASENVSPPYIYDLLKLPWPAPDIVTAILEGRQPDHLNASRLM